MMHRDVSVLSLEFLQRRPTRMRLKALHGALFGNILMD